MKNLIGGILGVIAAILIGTIFMGVSNEEEVLESTGSEYITYKVFQIGAFNDLENAEEEANKRSAIVVEHNNLYNVYIGVLKNTDNISKMNNYLKKEGIYYYIKDITVNQNLDSMLNEYEVLMQSSSSEVAFLRLNNNILKTFKENYED